MLAGQGREAPNTVRHQEGKSASGIAVIVDCHRTTISRELKRNQVAGDDDAAKAQRRYQEHRLECRPKRKLEHQPRGFVSGALRG